MFDRDRRCQDRKMNFDVSERQLTGLECRWSSWNSNFQTSLLIMLVYTISTGVDSCFVKYINRKFKHKCVILCRENQQLSSDGKQMLPFDYGDLFRTFWCSTFPAYGGTGTLHPYVEINARILDTNQSHRICLEGLRSGGLNRGVEAKAIEVSRDIRKLEYCERTGERRVS